MSLSRTTASLSVLLLPPPRCVACRSSCAVASSLLCDGCQAALPWLAAPLCGACALPCCGAGCPARGLAFSASWAPLAHRGPARRLVAALKFHGAPAVADAMGAVMARHAPAEMLDNCVLVPVPPDPLRRRVRGVDHTALLARAVARAKHRRVVHALRRRAPARAQSLLGRDARRATAGLAVSCVVTAPGAALLIDDVHTTGATLHACAQALLDAGSTRVAAVTFTRTLP